MSGRAVIIDVPRARDEELLDWLALRDEGLSYREIARRYGRNPGVVQTAIKNVHAAMETNA